MTGQIWSGDDQFVNIETWNDVNDHDEVHAPAQLLLLLSERRVRLEYHQYVDEIVRFISNVDAQLFQFNIKFHVT